MIRVGVVGAGPWATMVHAPVFSAGPETELSGVWARRPEAAQAIVDRHGGEVYADVDALLAASDVVAFAVPPDVQAGIGVQAAEAGKALVLEKPIALTLPDAERLAAAAAGVPTLVVLSWRYAAAVRAYLADVAATAPLGGRAIFASGAALGGPFATPWRLEHGPLFDLGPHVLDLLDAAMGTIVDVRAAGDPLGWITLACTHESGVTSAASLTMSTGIQPHRAGIEVYTADRVLELDCASAVGVEAFSTLRAELAELVANGTTHPSLGVERGLHLQRLIDAAARQLSSTR